MSSRFRQVIISITICLVIMALSFAFYFRHNAKNIPSIPASANINPYLKEQVDSTRKKAVYFPSAGNIGNLGMVYNSAEYYDEATKCYTIAAGKDPASWEWNYYLGYMNLELGKSEAAVQAFGKIIKRSPVRYMAMYYTASAWQNLNVPDSAEKYFRLAGEADTKLFTSAAKSRMNFFPLPVYAKFRFASLCMNTNRNEIAEKILNEITRDYVTFGPAYRQLSNLYSMKGDSAQSRYYSSRANDLTIFSPPPDSLIDKLSLISRSDVFLMKQIDIAIRSANSRWAVDLLRHGLVYLSDNKFFISRAVKQFLSVGMSKAALPYIDRHFSFFSDDSGELLETGRLLADAGLTEQAGRYFTRAFENSKNNAGVQSEIALLFVQKGLKQEGLKLMSGLLNEARSNAKIASDAAFMYLELNDRENTLKYFELIKQLSPGDVKLDILNAIVAEKDGKTGEAASLYEKAFARDTRNIYVIDHLSNIYLREEQWGKAVSFLKKALTVYPNSSALQEKLGGLLVACPDPAFRNIPAGREYSERAFINYNYTIPVRISAGRNLALAYYDMGDIRNARLYIGKTVMIAENNNVSKDYLKNLESLQQEFSK